MRPFYIYLIVICVMSIITLIAYAIDKKKAMNGKWRTKEKTLLTLSMMGGSIGGIIALYGLRHKNKHSYFVVVNFTSLIIDIALGVLFYIISF